MKNLEFDFSIDYDGDVEDICEMEGSNLECELFTKRLLENKKIGLGERSEGLIVVENDVVKLDYRVCTSVGGDWNEDSWTDMTDEFPVTVLQGL